MKNSDLSITDSFWNFIEANVPNYHEREDVLHQGELQLFIDGHESTVQGITREEAFLLRDKILYGLFAEAIATFTARHPVEFPGNVSLRDYSETLVDIAYEVGRRQYRLSSNSRETVRTIIGWADEFSRRHENTDWSTIEYLDEIDNFTKEKLRTARTRHDSPYVLVEFPDDTAYFEENDIGYPSFQSKDNGARYVPEYDYIRYFQKGPAANVCYKPLRWPESQPYLFSDESTDTLNEPINDKKGIMDFGYQAVWVPLCNIES